MSRLPALTIAFTGTLEPSDMVLGLAAILAIVWALLVMWQRSVAATRAAQPPAARAASAPAPRQAGPAADVGADLEELATEIERLSRRLNAELDDRAQKLESLLRDADARIAELRRLRGESPSASAASSAPAAPASSHAHQVPAGVASPALASTAPLALAASVTATATSPVSAPTLPAGQADAPGPDALARSVYALADDGHDSLEIAHRLREHVGKVELILALRSA